MYIKILSTLLLIQLSGCQTITRIWEKNAAIRSTSLKTEQDFAAAAKKLSIDVERCEAGGLQDCVYGLPFGPASEEGGKSLALGICSSVKTYFDHPERAPCRLVCANTELAHRKECIGAYGYTAVLYDKTPPDTFPVARTSADIRDLGPALSVFWSALRSSVEWTTFSTEEARTMAVGGSLIARTLKEKFNDGVHEYIVTFEGYRVGFVRKQRLPQDVDGQFFLAKSEEKYGKAERLASSAPFSKLYRWTKLGKRHRLMGIARGHKEGSELGRVDGVKHKLAMDGMYPLFARGSPDQLITVIIDIEKMRELIDVAAARKQLQKEGENEKKSNQLQQEINAIRY